MKLDPKSKVLLSITKSKAKMYEFGIDEEHHIKLPIEPQKLLRLTIGILGEYAALIARENKEDDYEEINTELKSQLIDVSQYFDSLQQSKLESSYSSYLTLLGSASYYLADMPGSSIVLANVLEYDIENLTPSFIEGVIVWLLKGNINQSYYQIENSLFQPELAKFVISFTKFFKRQSSERRVMRHLKKLKEAVYDHGNDRELFFTDILSSIAIKKLENSVFKCLPIYTGLEIEVWEPILTKPGFISEFWPAQKLLGENHVFRGKSAVIQMPTSSGKTKSTELIIRSAFLDNRTNLAVIVAPYRSLCREISDSFKKLFDNEDIKLNELQDIPQLNPEESEMINELLGIDDNDKSNSVIGKRSMN